MKIIDILVKKANGTLEDGFEFAYDRKIFTYNKKKDIIINDYNDCLGKLYKVEIILNDKVKLFQKTDTNEVELIEENKEIEELNEYVTPDRTYVNSQIPSWKSIKETIMIINENYNASDRFKFIIINKINELVRAVKVLKDNIKEREEK